ncbi:MAG: glycoside hydrolase family 13 protein [Ruminococcaceae bacterium]|nr:glycoside hydrolase family 13 protein [Oscillospiraceae bacterium]
MINILYDSKSKTFKNPFGAVKNGEKVCFSIHVFSDTPIQDVKLIYKNDSEKISNNISMIKEGECKGFSIYALEISFNTPDLYFYRFEVKTQEGTYFIGLKDEIAAVGDSLDEWQITVYDKDFKTPDWAKGSVMYQIFPDRFARSDNFSPLTAKNERKIHTNWYDVPEFIYDTPHYRANDYFCGNIEGIIEKLEYIKSLGVSIIYLNPIFESPEYHRYSTGNYLNVDPYFGTNEQFEKLCRICKEKGIRIILDGVFSHTGADSIYFNKYSNYESVGAFNSLDSPYYDWYNFHDYPNKYESWWGFENLPNVNETNPEYLKYITGRGGVTDFWQGLGASGWRLDVADELPDEFLDSLYSSIKSKDENALVIGEVWEDATTKFAYGKRRRYLLGGQMDSVMNYPWRTAILDFVKYADEKLFCERLLNLMENYPPHVIHCLMNIISTHDTMRTITHFGVESDIRDEDKGRYVMSENEYRKGKKLLLLAAFLQFTLPGIPCIYYGDEVGLWGFGDPYCRMAYPYGKEDVEIFDYYKRLGSIRNTYKEDFVSEFKVYTLADGLFAFTIGNLLCAINSGDKKQYIKAENKEIIFSHGENSLFSHGIDIFSKSVVILK